MIFHIFNYNSQSNHHSRIQTLYMDNNNWLWISGEILRLQISSHRVMRDTYSHGFAIAQPPRRCIDSASGWVSIAESSSADRFRASDYMLLVVVPNTLLQLSMPAKYWPYIVEMILTGCSETIWVAFWFMLEEVSFIVRRAEYEFKKSQKKYIDVGRCKYQTGED